jgi:hypothetical protein
VNARDYIEAIREEMARAGITNYEFEHGGKHPRVVWVQGKQRKFYVYPASPSDSRHGILNMLADLRRELGIAPPMRGKSTRAPKARAKAPPAAMPEITVKGDPLLRLKAWKPPSRFAWFRLSGNSWRVQVLAAPTQDRRG